MNKKIVFRVTGRLLGVLALLMLLPMTVSIIYKESDVFFSFLITALVSLIIGTALKLATRGCSNVMYAREGFLTVALAWFAVSLVGCMPFMISGEIPNFADAYFEMVSGFTTTGASIVTDVTSLSRGILFWRSFSHWIGGMGVLVFIVAFANSLSDRAIHILRAEMPGPVVGKIVPRSKDTSKVLYTMYIVLTLVQTLLLMAGGMTAFESIIHAFGTAGTGGFGLRPDSIGGYSPYIQWVIGIFMVIFGVNFNLYYLVIIKRFKAVLKSVELWTFLGIIGASTLLISFNIRPLFDGIGETVRHAFFQVSTVISTTGYATADFNLWPGFSKAILLLLMFLGGCAGSTAGGLKVSRAVILFKMIAKEIKRMIHPRSVVTVKFEGKEVDDHLQKSVSTYFAVYMLCVLAVFLVLSLEPFDFETNFTATVACFNNVGPGFGLVGPEGSFAMYSDAAKLLLSFAMILGRLEIFPILIALIPSTWKRKK